MKMKKVLTIILATATVLSMVACNSAKETEVTTTDTSVIETEETETSEITEVTEETTEETEETEVTEETTEETEEASESEVEETLETTEETTAETSDVPEEKPQSTPAPTSAPSNTQSQNTPAPTATPQQPVPEVSVVTHTKEEWMQIQGISQYTSTDGVTVYGKFVDTSSLDAAVNNYRASLGLAPYAIGSDNSICKQAAINGYSSDAPYHHTNVNNYTNASASEAYNAFYNSEGHRAEWNAKTGTYPVYDTIDGDQTVTITMTSASFAFYEYNGDELGFGIKSYSTVQRFDRTYS